jgi:hypothetical protein
MSTMHAPPHQEGSGTNTEEGGATVDNGREVLRYQLQYELTPLGWVVAIALAAALAVGIYLHFFN